ncbi:MAG: orotidine 5'-phosphate decarboxylase [Phycisphaerae bacterium]|jgi:orotidine-5'-phosphate decarboxylase|nr:MAG: orotidine 5'-phosphate decarboxylase [Phycisphaerae bacterium]
MSEVFVDRLIDAIRTGRPPICVGLDPMLEAFPVELQPKDHRDLDACVDALHAFCTGVLEVVAPVVPIVKFQIAYFEQFLWEGVRAYYELVREAQSRGLLVIGDIKRGDIGSTSDAYAAGHLAEIEFHDSDDVAVPDAVTINPFLGLDAIDPFLQVCKDEGKGVFVLVRTSNPGSRDLQDRLTDDGRTFSELIADTLQPIASSGHLMGRYGYSNLGAVVGATQTHTMSSLRKRLPNSFFLLPGYGTQGATGEMTRSAFDSDGLGAVVSASRSLLYPKRREGESWRDSVRRALDTMVSDIRSVVGKSS